jgi:hypothetical protein
MPPFNSVRALPSKPNDSCSNDSEHLNSDGSCHKYQLDLNSWSNIDTPETVESSGDGGVGSASGYNTENGGYLFDGDSGLGSVSGYNTVNGYLFDEQWISCVSDSEQSLKNKDYLVQAFNFIYEIYTPVDDSNDDVLETLANFERNLSLGVSKYLGLVPCADSAVTELSVARSAGPWLRRSLTSLKNDHRFLGDEETTSGVLAVSMMPKDEIDYESACTSTVQTDEPAVCSHVVGGMTAWINKADGASIPNDDMFLKAVESYIKDDNSTYLGNGLLHVEYIGELETTTYTKIGNSAASSTGHVAVGLALAGVVLVVAGVGGGWLYRKKRRKNQDDVYAESQDAKSVVSVENDEVEIQLQETAEAPACHDGLI